MRITLTESQTAILTKLSSKPMTVNELVNVLNKYDGHWNTDKAASSLRRLENRQLVRRIQEYGRVVNTWEVTSFGRFAIK